MEEGARLELARACTLPGFEPGALPVGRASKVLAERERFELSRATSRRRISGALDSPLVLSSPKVPAPGAAPGSRRSSGATGYKPARGAGLPAGVVADRGFEPREHRLEGGGASAAHVGRWSPHEESNLDLRFRKPAPCAMNDAGKWRPRGELNSASPRS